MDICCIKKPLLFGAKIKKQIFSHPDYTVGFGIAPNRAERLADYTAGGESHSAPKISI